MGSVIIGHIYAESVDWWKLTELKLFSIFEFLKITIACTVTVYVDYHKAQSKRSALIFTILKEDSDFFLLKNEFSKIKINHDVIVMDSGTLFRQILHFKPSDAGL